MRSLKKIVLAASALVCAGTVAFAGELDTQQAKEAYSMGASVGNYISDQIYKQGKLGLSADMALVEKGFQDAIRGKSKISEDDMLKYLNSRAEKLNKLEAAANEKLAKENKAKATKFLAENAKKKGVTTTKSGLQYEVIKEGNGKRPKETDRVRCHYEGTLIDGTLFDSSIKRGEPAVFGVNQVIKGWVEALQLMSEGAKWKLYIPSELAYGAQGAGEMIPPHSTLIFEVELIEVL